MSATSGQSPEQVSETVNEIPVLKNVDGMAEGAKKNVNPVGKAVNQNQVKMSQETVETAMKPEYNMEKEVGGVEDAGKLNTGTGSIRERNVERLKQGRAENSSQMESQGVFGAQNSGTTSGFRIIPDSVRSELNNLGVTNNEFRDTTSNPELFSFALESGKRSNMHGAMVDSHTAEELTESGALTFLSKDNMAGGAVMPDSNITAVFKNSNSKSKRAATDIIVEAVENGGERLDCYGDDLVDMYSRIGFEPVAKVKFNPEYAPDGWDFEKLGEPYIYVMAHNGDSVESVVRKMSDGTYRLFEDAELEALSEMDYEDAIVYRNKILEERYAFMVQKK